MKSLIKIKKSNPKFYYLKKELFLNQIVLIFFLKVCHYPLDDIMVGNGELEMNKIKLIEKSEFNYFFEIYKNNIQNFNSDLPNM